MVDEVPFAVVFDGAKATAEKIHVHGQQGRFQQAEDGIVGRVVEVSPGDDPVDTDGCERVRQEAQSLHGNPPPGFRPCRSPVFRRMVVHQDREYVVMPDPDRASITFF